MKLAVPSACIEFLKFFKLKESAKKTEDMKQRVILQFTQLFVQIGTAKDLIRHEIFY